VASAALGGATYEGTVDVAITYVDTSLYLSQALPKNAESNPSARKSVTLTSGLGVTLDLTGLNPPNGALAPRKLAQSYALPLNASAYNVWVGVRGGTLYLQNATPIAITSRTYALSADPLLSGSVAQEGQWPEAYRPMYQTVNRA
jgi:hypothetical protein